jgi:hypothetical protein
MPTETRSRLNSDSRRADQGHITHVTGKGITPVALRRDQQAEPRVELKGNPENRIVPPVSQHFDSRRR